MGSPALLVDKAHCPRCLCVEPTAPSRAQSCWCRAGPRLGPLPANRCAGPAGPSPGPLGRLRLPAPLSLVSPGLWEDMLLSQGLGAAALRCSGTTHSDSPALVSQHGPVAPPSDRDPGRVSLSLGSPDVEQGCSLLLRWQGEGGRAGAGGTWGVRGWLPGRPEVRRGVREGLPGSCLPVGQGPWGRAVGQGAGAVLGMCVWAGPW